MAQVVRHGHHAMGRVSIWAQWLGVAVGVLLSSVFVLNSGLVYRLVTRSSIMATAGRGAWVGAYPCSAGWSGSAGVRRSCAPPNLSRNR
jgi:hypothetical protein